MKVNEQINNKIKKIVMYSPSNFYKLFLTRLDDIDPVIYRPFMEIRDIDVRVISTQVKEEVLKE